jgi:hypothetical protein
MTLYQRSSMVGAMIDDAQVHVIQSAGGSLMGWFAWTDDGWELSLERLTFQELLRVIEAAKQVLQ